MNRKNFRSGRFLTGSLIVFLVWTLVGTSALAAEQTTKVTVGVPHKVLFDVSVPVYVAQEKGFFKEAGLEVDTVFTKGGGENVQSVVAGDVNIGLATGFFAILSAFAKGAPINVASAEMTGMPDIYWYVPGSSSIKKLDDVAGKRIAYSRPGSSTNMAALAVSDQLKAKGLKPCKAVSLGGLSGTFTGVKTGQADVGWAAAPFFLDRVDRGEIRIIFRGGDITKLNDLTVRVNFVNANFAKDHPDAVKGFFRAHQKAIDFIFDRPEETTDIWIKRAGLKFSKAQVLKSWDFYTKSAMAYKPIKGVQATMQDAIKFKFLKKPLTQTELGKLIDHRYLP
jgi:NitT/TauT family transport system substrate-binding protein